MHCKNDKKTAQTHAPVYLATSIFSLKMSPPSGGRTNITMKWQHKDPYNNQNTFDIIHNKHVHDDQLYNV